LYRPNPQITAATRFNLTVLFAAPLTHTHSLTQTIPRSTSERSERWKSKKVFVLFWVLERAPRPILIDTIDYKVKSVCFV